MSQRFFLSPGELKTVTVKASHGDCESCERLSDYYSFIKFDTRQALHWEERALKLGSERAAHNIAALKEVMEENTAESRPN